MQIPRLSARVWRLLLLVGFLNFGRSAAVTYLAFLFIARFHLNPTGIGALLSAGTLSSLVMGFIAGPLVDHLGARRGTTIGLVFGGLAIAGIGWSHSIPLTIALNLLSGASWSIYSPAIRVALAAAAGHDKDRAFGLNYWIHNVAQVVGPATGAIVGWHDRGGLITAYGLLSMSLAVLAALTVPPTAQHPPLPRQIPQKFPYRRHWRLMIDRRLIFLLLTNVIVFFVESQFESVFPQVLSHQIQDAIALYGVSLSLMALVVVIAVFPLQGILNTWTTRRQFLVGTLVQTAGLSGLLFLRIVPIWLAALILYSIGEVMAAWRMGAYTADIAPQKAQGTYFALTNQASTAGYFLGPVVGGFAYQMLGVAGWVSMLISVSLVSLWFLAILTKPKPMNPMAQEAVRDSEL
ncbi:MFS transporter [Sulfobacillus thermosulfidooxidans]|uniref:MFS transporter n=1 Tax=Sulfobacillus thermosulfidooxidans TaxID=28034 RepID=UPI0003F8763F|nr:MFS transporter [Sulfobacillus thermosulfidooxidans]